MVRIAAERWTVPSQKAKERRLKDRLPLNCGESFGSPSWNRVFPAVEEEKACSLFQEGAL